MVNLLQRARVSVRHEPHAFNGNTYWGMPLTTWRPNEEGISAEFANLVSGAYKSNAIVFACELTRIALFAEARFQWRRMYDGRPGDLYGTPALSVLERPWPGGTTGDLLARMLQDADFGGSAFVARQHGQPDRLKRMRPDWVTIVLGSNDDPAEANKAMDADIIGYMYHPGGIAQGGKPVTLLADEVAHFAPNPDPLAAYRGTSWLTPVLREIEADTATTAHKLMFFRNGATPQLVIVPPAGVTQETVDRFARQMAQVSEGFQNAYRTMYVAPGSSVIVAGKDLQQLDFKVTQGAGETRIAAASGVHPVVAALSEGMAGSSLNAGNFRAACRLVADRTLRPLWRGACTALETIVPAPGGSALWFDERDISFLQEDRKDAAEIQFILAQTIRQLTEAGYETSTIIAAVQAEDMGLLRHSGLTSVQLQPPSTATTNGASANGQALPAGATVTVSP